MKKLSAWERLDNYIEYVGHEYALGSLAKAMGQTDLADLLDYIFRVEGFNENGEIEDEEE